MKKTNEIMFELEDQRQANRKIYRMKNGQNMMILGREPVHYFDVESEEYKEIDGTLKNTSGGYVGQFGNCRVSLPNGKGNDRVIRIGNDLHKIEWRYSGMNKDRFDDAYETNGMAYSVPKIVYKKRFPNIKHNNPDAHFGENAVVRYDNIEDGIGFEYEVRTNCLKENIYISKLREKYSFFMI